MNLKHLPVVQPNGIVKVFSPSDVSCLILESDLHTFRKPPHVSWAATARFMADLYPDHDWDTWKDEMKDRDEL